MLFLCRVIVSACGRSVLLRLCGHGQVQVAEQFNCRTDGCRIKSAMTARSLEDQG
jgi:hypothetical protein